MFLKLSVELLRKHFDFNFQSVYIRNNNKFRYKLFLEIECILIYSKKLDD